jgi:hypothetical protein
LLDPGVAEYGLTLFLISFKGEMNSVLRKNKKALDSTWTSFSLVPAVANVFQTINNISQPAMGALREFN